MLNSFRLISPSILVCRSSKALSCLRSHGRSFADNVQKDLTTTSKQLITGTENEQQRVRVRRARSSDVPRVLRFVREHSRCAWPSLVSAPVAPTAASQLVLADYVARALAQGHTMVAEQIASRRGWLTVRGLALGSAVCPWDAQVLERWARCMRDARAQRLVNFTAHCLRGPALHEKYRVHNILQVILILSPESQNSSEIVQMLVKSSIQRGREVGIPLLRFDVTNETVAKTLDDMKLNREWCLSYDVLPDQALKEGGGENLGYEATEQTLTASTSNVLPVSTQSGGHKGNFIAVYTALTNTELPTQPEESQNQPLDTQKPHDTK